MDSAHEMKSPLRLGETMPQLSIDIEEGKRRDERSVRHATL
ncbi:MAG: hypothetical protein Q4B91_08700 [Atopobiaceae bacterium]|nr:hypothetical protein [Atopobiaceae bacterium]